MKLIDLRVEYRKNPIGMDVNPRFSWKMRSEEKDTMQSAYQIEVANQNEVVWDSGRIVGEDSVLIPYQGIPLELITKYQVKVNVWDNHGKEACINGSFETGLLSQDNWKGKWITHELPKEESACPIFETNMEIKNKKISKARFYATACGVYEIQINGKKAGDAFLAPGWTSYHHRLQYQTYDIGDLLQQGVNTISVPVGNGWYKGYLNGEGEKAFYGNQVAFLGMMDIEYADGEKLVVGTDTNWNVATGSIQSSELYFGETQNLLKLRKGESEKQTQQAVLFDASVHINSIVAQEPEPIRVTRRFPVKEKIITPKGELVFDFGQNMAGLVEIRLPMESPFGKKR